MSTEEEFRVIETFVKRVFEKYRVSNHSEGDKAVLKDEIKSIFKEKQYSCPIVEFKEDGLDEVITLKNGDVVFFEAKRQLVPYFTYQTKRS